MKKVFIIFSILFITVSFSHISLGAGEAGYQPLTPVPGLSSNIQTGTEDGKSSLGFAGYLKALYVWGVAAASGLAVVMIMWGGVEYMTSAGGGGVEEAKKRISSAIAGLLLALGSYIILYTINRDLLNLQFTIGRVNTTVNPNAAAKIIPQTTNNSAYNGSIGASMGGYDDYYDYYPGSIGGSMNGSNTGDINYSAIDAALASYRLYGDRASNKEYIGVMDYSQSSSEARFYIVNTRTGEISSTLASHGKGSDPYNTGYATDFSAMNEVGSKQSALGAFIAQPYYSDSMGKNALKLQGLEAGVNDKSGNDRGLAIHSSDYVTETSCGRSQGCIAVSNTTYEQISPLLNNAFIYNYK